MCKGGNCEYYQLESDGLEAGVFPDGTLFLRIAPGDQINYTTQQNTLTSSDHATIWGGYKYLDN